MMLAGERARPCSLASGLATRMAGALAWIAGFVHTPTAQQYVLRVCCRGRSMWTCVCSVCGGVCGVCGVFRNLGLRRTAACCVPAARVSTASPSPGLPVCLCLVAPPSSHPIGCGRPLDRRACSPAQPWPRPWTRPRTIGRPCWSPPRHACVLLIAGAAPPWNRASPARCAKTCTERVPLSPLLLRHSVYVLLGFIGGPIRVCSSDPGTLSVGVL